MKSQDIGLLFKLVTLQKAEKAWQEGGIEPAWPMDWQDWSDQGEDEDQLALAGEHSLANPEYVAARYTARALEQETGISKSQIHLSLKRCYEIGLAKPDRHLGVPRVNTRALFNLVLHGLKYVFPARPGAMSRGIATSFAAPILQGKLMSTGDTILVWPDARGNTKGQAVEPLFKSVTYAVRRDPEMYALLALADAIRLGYPREANLASELLQKQLELK